mgnify:CR=1 FL=1
MKRQQVPEEMNICFLRFSEQEVRKDMDIVLKEIRNYIVQYEQSHVVSGEKEK